jgi:hypothetical protein
VVPPSTAAAEFLRAPSQAIDMHHLIMSIL